MAVAKNKKTGKWYSKFRYKDYAGAVIQKKREGFDKKSEAQAWEKDFLAVYEGKERLTFEAAYKKYFADCEKRLKPSTIKGKKTSYKYFERLYSIPIAEITPTTIREWQNECLLAIDAETGKTRFTKKTIETINAQLSTFFKWCMRFCGLQQNPVYIAGTLTIKGGMEKDAHKIAFWQKEDFDQFMTVVKNPSHRLLFLIMFYTGARAGEALGLRFMDIDANNKIMHIRQNRVRNFQIGTPKTKSSIRDVTLPSFIVREYRAYKRKIYNPAPNSLIFEIAPLFLYNLFMRYVRRSGAKKIRLHDLRHSHASMLINEGFSPQAVADRLGHKNAEMVLRVYGHLYEQRRDEIANKLDAIYIGKK